MSRELLDRVRTLNSVLSKSATGFVSFEEICKIMYDMLGANVYVMNIKGKVLAAKFNPGEEAPLELNRGEGQYILPSEYNDKYLEVTETRENLTYDAVKEIYGEGYELSSKFHTIVPVIFGGRRVATLLFVRAEKAFDDEDIALCEYGATVVGIEVTRSMALEEKEELAHKGAVTNALETLSYSELEAVKKIFAELGGDEGLLVASKIADQSGITRSVIVNALRKLESARVIESRSLGMKGTRIKIINSFLREEIDKIKI